MKAFFDTNVLVAAVTADTDRSDTAIRLLNEVDDGYTSIVNLMELRNVLAKKKAFERQRIESVVNARLYRVNRFVDQYRVGCDYVRPYYLNVAF